MHNAFLVIRSVFFALLTYIHVLILVSASWNIITVKSSGMSTPGASVFLLTSSLFIFVFVPIAYLSELICAKPRPTHVKVECAWTVSMSTFQLAASVCVTVNGPPIYCHMQLSWGMCASSSLLVCVSWLATLIIFSYCFAICVASTAHATHLPDIWITPVSRVPWFCPDIESPAPVDSSQGPNRKSSLSTSWCEASSVLSKYITERWENFPPTKRSSTPTLSTKGGPPFIDTNRPNWARQYSIRRGIDDPFVKPLPGHVEPSVVLAPPPRIRSKYNISS